MAARCDARRALVASIGSLTCAREPNHAGIHRDGHENVWWMDGAPPLEVIEIPQAREETR